MHSRRKWVLIVLLAGSVLGTSGCHTITPAVVADAQKLGGKKQLYVVNSTRKDRGFRKEIERNLKGRGFVVTSGPMEGLEAAGPELYVVYDDRWSWDMVMYPSKVTIALYDAKSREMLGTAEFKNTFTHTFPDPPELADELLGRIFGEPAGSHMK